MRHPDERTAVLPPPTARDTDEPVIGPLGVVDDLPAQTERAEEAGGFVRRHAGAETEVADFGRVADRRVEVLGEVARGELGEGVAGPGAESGGDARVPGGQADGSEHVVGEGAAAVRGGDGDEGGDAGAGFQGGEHVAGVQAAHGMGYDVDGLVRGQFGVDGGSEGFGPYGDGGRGRYGWGDDLEGGGEGAEGAGDAVPVVDRWEEREGQAEF